MEKAHRDVFNILLQVLDDGRLSDSLGHTVDFTNTIVVMTSNVGSQQIQEITERGGSEKEIRQIVHETLRDYFLPEFLNRVDEVIVFHPLTRAEVRRIAGLQVRRLRQQLEQNGILLEISDAAIAALAAEGYDPTFGARPLKRVVQQKIQNPLALEILNERLPPGSTVNIDRSGDDYTFSASAAG
jgi:ATP-dependent Clp protease ATP-binding subunit ClpB